ncbi:Nuclear pore complex protein Nup85 [Apophysomyces ossiformis]|uniref:Nuclear pore complex protein Nup85 n=1 Tax=Apophysomyces ossiformis TaxID=679940 RepID=A0A8H7BX57_9FUNG|nr:Nuclear pore complex protein Nup85 [Apophysomyces ossiformis]
MSAPDQEEKCSLENEKTVDTTADEEQCDLIFEHIGKINSRAPKTEEEFYKASFHIFSELDQFRRALRPSKTITSDSILSDRDKGTGAYIEDRKAAVASYAKDYTDLLRDYLQQLEEVSTGLATEMSASHCFTSKNKSEEQDKLEIQRIHDVLRIWDLCELLYFSEEEEDGAIMAQLSDWLNMYWPIEEYGDEDDTRQDLWTLISRHLLRSNLSEATQLLQAKQKELSDTQQVYANWIVELIQSMPKLSANAAAADHITKWKEWHAQTLKIYNDMMLAEPDVDEVDVHQSLTSILEILAGVKEAIVDSGSYFEALTGFLMYNQPFRTRNDLALVAGQLDINENDTVAAACHHIILKNWEDAFEALDDHWLQVHLGLLLIASGYLPDADMQSSEQEVTVDPIYYVIEAYAEFIAKRYHMWNEAVDYINVCKPNAEIWISRLLSQSYFSPGDAELVQSLFDQFSSLGLFYAERSLYKILAKKEDEEGKVYKATIHYARAEDMNALEAIAQRILKQYLETGTLDGVVSETDEAGFLLQCPTYSFLLGYYELRRHIESQDLESAATLLMGLITSLDAPEEFRTVLLVDSFCIQQATRQIVFDSDETTELLHQYQLALTHPAQYDLFGPYFKRVKSSSQGITEVVVAQIRERLAYNQAMAMA